MRDASAPLAEELIFSGDLERDVLEGAFPGRALLTWEPLVGVLVAADMRQSAGRGVRGEVNEGETSVSLGGCGSADGPMERQAKGSKES